MHLVYCGGNVLRPKDNAHAHRMLYGIIVPFQLYLKNTVCIQSIFDAKRRSSLRSRVRERVAFKEKSAEHRPARRVLDCHRKVPGCKAVGRSKELLRVINFRRKL